MMRRSLACLPLAGALAWGSGPVHATSFDLIWTGATGGVVSGLGTNSLVMDGSDAQVTLDLVVNADAAGAGILVLSVAYDYGLHNELDFISGAECPELCGSDPARRLDPFTPPAPQEVTESVPGSRGFLRSFEAATLDEGPANESFVFARMVFDVNGSNVATDGGVDLLAGTLDTRYDGVFDNAGSPVRVASPVARIDVFRQMPPPPPPPPNGAVPEPGSAMLFAIGAFLVSLTSRGMR